MRGFILSLFSAKKKSRNKVIEPYNYRARIKPEHLQEFHSFAKQLPPDLPPNICVHRCAAERGLVPPSLMGQQVSTQT